MIVNNDHFELNDPKTKVVIQDDETVVVGVAGIRGATGEKGDTGIIIDTEPPENIEALWADESDPGDMVIPPGGAQDDLLAKVSGSDYDTGWVSPATLAGNAAFTTAFAPATPAVGTALATTGTVALDMALLNGTYQSIALTGDPTFTTSNRAAGRTVTIKLVAGGSSRNLAWPSWVFVGSAAPVSLAANKSAVVTVTMFDTTDAGAIAAYAAEP